MLAEPNQSGGTYHNESTSSDYLSRWTVRLHGRHGQHTGLTDLPLAGAGERNARRLAKRLKGLTFDNAFTSLWQRAVRTCSSRGSVQPPKIDCDLVEGDYGEYKGPTTAEIRAERPDWQLFRDSCPDGESQSRRRPGPIRVVIRMRAVHSDV